MNRAITVIVSVMLLLFVNSCEKSENASSDGHKKSGAVAVQNARRSLPEDAVRLAPTAIIDWTGFRQPMVAATMFIPYGWVAEGGIAWGNQYACTNGYAYNWIAKSPDDTHGVAILPQQRWEWNATGKALKPGCGVAQIDSVPAYIKTVLGQVRPDARVINSYRRSDLEQKFASLNKQSDTGFQYIKDQIQVAEAIIEFTEKNRPMRGVVTAAVLFSYIRTGGGAYGATTENWIGYALPSYIAYAPTSKFKRAFFEGIRRSFTPDPQWEQAIAGHNATMGRIEREGIMKRAEITRQTYEEIREMSKKAWDRQKVSADRRAREFSEYIRDVETYDDPKSDLGQVELDSGYEHAWRLGDGTYVLTNDHSFNPVKTTGQFGEQLKISR
jgi:hypothetical protein